MYMEPFESHHSIYHIDPRSYPKATLNTICLFTLSATLALRAVTLELTKHFNTPYTSHSGDFPISACLEEGRKA